MAPIITHPPHPRCAVCNGRLKFATCWGHGSSIWTCDGRPCKNEEPDGRVPMNGWDSIRWRCVNDCDFDMCEECITPPAVQRLVPCTSLTIGQKVYYYTPSSWCQDWTNQRVWEVKRLTTTGSAILHLGGSLLPPPSGFEVEGEFEARLEECYDITSTPTPTEYTARGEILL